MCGDCGDESNSTSRNDLFLPAGVEPLRRTNNSSFPASAPAPHDNTQAERVDKHRQNRAEEEQTELDESVTLDVCSSCDNVYYHGDPGCFVAPPRLTKRVRLMMTSVRTIHCPDEEANCSREVSNPCNDCEYWEMYKINENKGENDWIKISFKPKRSVT